jgi:hypothetical protein
MLVHCFGVTVVHQVCNCEATTLQTAIEYASSLVNRLICE